MKEYEKDTNYNYDRKERNSKTKNQKNQKNTNKATDCDKR